MIRAAGGLVWRPATAAVPTDGRLVCLVHRPRHDDWSLPKGKLEHGEHPLTAAVREVAEEVGVTAVPQLSLPSSRYLVGGTEKRVHYWAMVSAEGVGAGRAADLAGPVAPATAAASDIDSEVDEVVWLPVPEAIELVSYPQDADLIRWWRNLPPVTAVVLLVRHSDAGSRDTWQGSDSARPLTEHGRADAAELARLLTLFAPTRLVSATPRRCTQTLAPLAAATALDVESDRAFDETSPVGTATAQLRSLAAAGGTTVVCSQGGLLPAVLAGLAGDEALVAATGEHGTDRSTAKGDGWLLPFSGRRLLAVAPLNRVDRPVVDAPLSLRRFRRDQAGT